MPTYSEFNFDICTIVAGWWIFLVMVLILDGSSEHGAHMWNKSGNSICWRHLVTAKEWSNLIYFSEKAYFTSYVRNMYWATIHGFSWYFYHAIWLELNSYYRFLNVCKPHALYKSKNMDVTKHSAFFMYFNPNSMGGGYKKIIFIFLFKCPCSYNNNTAY